MSTLPANPAIPADSELRNADQGTLRQLCRDVAKVAFSFRSKKHGGKQFFIKAETLRYRLGRIRDGNGMAWWANGADMATKFESGEDTQGIHATVLPTGEVTHDTETIQPEVEAEVVAAVKPSPVKADKSDKASQLMALIQSLAADQLDAVAVRAIATDVLQAAVKSGQLGTTVTVKHEVIQLDGTVKPISGVLPKCFKRILDYAKIRENIMLVGPAGCGKTYVAAKVAEALGLPFYFISCSAGMSEGNLSGRLLPVEAGGKFAYVAAPFVEAYENGGVFLLDEIDASDSNTLTFLNAAIANGRMSLPQRIGNPVAVKHKDFILIAAANTFGSGVGDRIYVGRNQLDGATIDRFVAARVFMDYDEAVEAEHIDPEVLAWGKRIRKVIYDKRLRRIMSTRCLISFTRQKRLLGYGRKEWEESYLADWNVDERAMLGA